MTAAALNRDSWGQTSLSYDSNGNLTNGDKTYAWNERNELASNSQSGSTVAGFAYDPLGRRSRSSFGAATTDYPYDGLNLVQEKTGTKRRPESLNGVDRFERIDELIACADRLVVGVLLSK